MKGEWKTVPQKYGPSIDYYVIGRVRVGSVNWAKFRSKNDPPAYDFYVDLPGFKEEARQGKCSTEAEARGRVAGLVNYWFKRMITNEPG